jgi:tetratricopeptide (TPR) repeat protein
MLSVFISSCATLTPAGDFNAFIKDIRKESPDFAFMRLSAYLRDNPGSAHTCEIRFALAEYYFQIKNYYDAFDELQYCIENDPKGKNAVFAYAMLYKIISEYPNDAEVLLKLKERFFSKSLFLVFSDSKTKSYTSILNNRYDVVDYVDKIEVFKNNEAFLEVRP